MDISVKIGHNNTETTHDRLIDTNLTHNYAWHEFIAEFDYTFFREVVRGVIYFGKWKEGNWMLERWWDNSLIRLSL